MPAADLLALNEGVEPLPSSPEVVALKKAAIDPSEHAADRLREILVGIHPTRLVSVGRQVRSRRGWVPRFDEMTVQQAQELLASHPDGVAAAAAVSLHRDGHVREVAVRAMKGSADPLVVPFLVLRCGEWTAEVRQTALSILDPWIHADHAALLVGSFPLLDRARVAWSRAASDRAERIETVLRSTAARPALLATIDNQDPITARTAVRIAADVNPTVDLLERAIKSGDAVSMALVARSLPWIGAVNQQVGELLWQHPIARLRQEGVYRLLKHGGGRAEFIATTAMRDRSESVRSTARRWLRDQGADPAALYRALPAEDHLAALLGLGDVPDEQDAAFARASLAERPAVRRAALRLLGKLGLSEDQEVFIDAFMNGTSRERRTSVAWFQRTGVTPDVIGTLWSRPNSATDSGEVRARVLQQLAPRISRWHQLEFALRACSDPDQVVVNAGKVLLGQVLYSSGFQGAPVAEQAGRLRSAFESAQPVLGADPSDRLRRLLQRVDEVLQT